MLVDLYHPNNYFGGESMKERVKYHIEDDISDMKVKLDGEKQSNEGSGEEEFQFEGKEINSHLELLNS